MRKLLLRRCGQATTETVILMPIYAIFIFFLLQIGQLGMALMVVNYGASSVARQIARSESDSSHAGIRFNNQGHVTGPGLVPIQQAYKKLMVVGMRIQEPGFRACSQGQGITRDVTVWASAQITTFPVIRQLLNAALNDTYAVPKEMPADCLDHDEKAFGPFYFAADGEYFVVRGKAMARLNYNTR